MKRTLFIIILSLCSLVASAQNKTITGVIVDKSNEPIIGASIKEVDTGNGIATDVNGKFSLTVKSGSKIQISYIGYNDKVLPASDFKTGTPLKIVLEEKSEILQEVVVTAYGGKQLRTKVTNSIAKVKDETLKQGLYANPAQALSGAVSGLRVEQTSGDPGASPRIVLRGGTNLDGTGSPLVVVDGQVRGNMSDINPDDISSMEVMKDAGATAIYGARANNGVILITTKKGKNGFSEIRFKSKIGFNYFNDVYNFLGGEDYLYYMRTAYKRSGQIWKDSKGDWKGIANMGTLSGIQPYGTGNLYFDPKTNKPLDGNKDPRAVWSTMKYTDNLAFLLNEGWKTMTDPIYGDKLIFKEFNLRDTNIDDVALTQDYNINFTGGNDRGNYYASIGYNKSNGNAVGNWYKRLNFTVNADYKIREWLTSTSNVTFSQAKWYGIYREWIKGETDIANYFGRVLGIPPTFRGTNADGELLLGRSLSEGNYNVNKNNFLRNNTNNKFNMGQAFTLNLMDGLTFKVSGNWYYNQTQKEAFNKDLLTGSRNGEKLFDTKHESYAFTDELLDQTYNGVFNYNKQLNEKHYISAMAGMEYYDSYYKGFDAYGYGAPVEDFMDLEYTITDKGAREIDSWHSRQRILSYFGRVNYDYMSKYLVSLVMRRDGYSKLVDNRWGFFPGISAGWVFSKEDFVNNLGINDVLSFGKLRLSYGSNGNVSGIGNYDLQGRYSLVKYGGNTGFLMTGLPNPGLRWEKSNTFEIGLDLGFLDNRLNLNMTYYNRRTKDKFANIDLPSHVGINSFKTNNGEIQNSGLEFDFNAKIINTKDWKWDFSLNGAFNKNKIITLPYNKLERNRQGAFEVYTGNGDEKMWVGGYQEGQRPGDIYVYKAMGIYNDIKDIAGNLIDMSLGNNGSNNKILYGPDAWAKLTDQEKSKGLPIQPGDVKWLDVNNDGKIDQFDKVKVGNEVPLITGGFNTRVGWKGLSLSARFDYALGHKVVDSRTPWILGNMQGTFNTLDLVKNSWSENNMNAKYPVYAWADQLGKRNYARESSMFVYKGDYLAFREISLSYQMPKEWVNKIFLQSAELSITGQNLGYLTAAKHVYSPEYGANSWGGYSLPRTLILGLNVSF